MKFDLDSAIARARQDLAARLKVNEGDITLVSSQKKEFSDMSLGAAASGEMSAQMISYGWQFELEHAGKSYEYRGDKYQLRLCNFNGENLLIAG